MSDWQPIETAPKADVDNPILIWEPGCVCPEIAFWMVPDPWKGSPYWAETLRYGVAMEAPTHWMPLPDPPTT